MLLRNGEPMVPTVLSNFYPIKIVSNCDDTRKLLNLLQADFYKTVTQAQVKQTEESLMFL